MTAVKMTARCLVEKYRDFFEKKGHRWIPSAPLPTQDDSSTLFISAGMQPLASYLLGEPHPLGKRLVNLQECVRTGDIELVGDTYHHTWFEMLGHWSLGDYFKKEAIGMTFEFYIEKMGFDINRLAFSVFGGNNNAPRDKEAMTYWQNLGISKERIVFLKENWWELVGGGPCGPSTEVFYWWDDAVLPPEKFDPKDERWLEIDNDVLMGYQKKTKGTYLPAKQKNIDNGTGVERNLAVINGLEDDYKTSVFWPIIEKIEAISGRKYDKDKKDTRAMRIIADHLRASVFIIADGIVPSNKEQGYVLRRLIRRIIRQGNLLGIKDNFVRVTSEAVFSNQNNYAGVYPKLNKNRDEIMKVLETEEKKFQQTLTRGLKECGKMVKNGMISPSNVFNLYQTYGFPVEMVEEEVNKKFGNDFKGKLENIKKNHQKLSQTAAAGKFKGGLASHSEKIVCYHTATHLLQAALRKILSEDISQAGSNITDERLRFDFNYPDKLTDKNKSDIEDLVNQVIEDNIEVKVKTMAFEKAKSEALILTGKDYPSRVTVYSIGTFSKEVCVGPHVKRTGLLGKFKIIKEESAGSGKRRIYGILN